MPAAAPRFPSAPHPRHRENRFLVPASASQTTQHIQRCPDPQRWKSEHGSWPGLPDGFSRPTHRLSRIECWRGTGLCLLDSAIQLLSQFALGREDPWACRQAINQGMHQTGSLAGWKRQGARQHFRGRAHRNNSFIIPRVGFGFATDNYIPDNHEIRAQRAGLGAGAER